MNTQVYAATEAVLEVGQIPIEGNITPSHWYKIFTFDNGKPHAVAVTLLAEIVYWYRPTIVREESSGHIVEIRKKFKGDFLQRSVKAFAEQFGFSAQQCRDALNFLQDKGMVRLHYRTVSFGERNELKATNVLFIELIPQQLKLIQKSVTYLPGSKDPLSSKQRPRCPQATTNTEITPEITTTTTDAAQAPERQPVQAPGCCFFQTLLEGTELTPREKKLLLKEYGDYPEEVLQQAVEAYKQYAAKADIGSHFATVRSAINEAWGANRDVKQDAETKAVQAKDACDRNAELGAYIYSRVRAKRIRFVNHSDFLEAKIDGEQLSHKLFYSDCKFKHKIESLLCRVGLSLKDI